MAMQLTSLLPRRYVCSPLYLHLLHNVLHETVFTDPSPASQAQQQIIALTSYDLLVV